MAPPKTYLQQALTTTLPADDRGEVCFFTVALELPIYGLEQQATPILRLDLGHACDADAFCSPGARRDDRTPS